ncbi:MAG: signal recognition particle-docking protein FtsY [Micrococcales bacterium]
MGLLFWRKKRKDEPEVGAAEGVGDSRDVEAPSAPPVDLKDVNLKPHEETSQVEAKDSALAAPKAKASRLFKSKPKVKEEVKPEPEPTPEPEPVLEVAPEPEPEPEPVVEVIPEPVAPVAEVELEAVELPKRSFGKNLKSLFTRIKFDIDNLDDLEDTLIQADFGLEAAEAIVEGVKQRAKKSGAKTDGELKGILVDLITEQLSRSDSALNLQDGKLPYVILVVGVNGVGKTTTIGKLANWLNEGQWRVVIGAADTFRAAAVEQIATWAERANAKLIRPKAEGQDPASVAFETVELALRDDADIAIIDTAGRLQNKKDLMAELEKIKRVVEKNAQISETLLVIDATTGQNGLAQAKAFAEVANVTGIVLTKLDGTAKGGIVFAIQKELGIPVKLVGVGEGIKDFAFFDAQEFAKGLVG